MKQISEKKVAAMRVFFAFFFITTFYCSSIARAEEESTQAGEKKEKSKKIETVEEKVKDPRGAVDLTVCSQNLENMGKAVLTQSRLNISPQQYVRKVQALAERFASKDCDVIGVQEVLGKNDEEAKEGLEPLILALRARTGRVFEAVFGEGTDPTEKVGFLVATDRAEVLLISSYKRVELPKLSPQQKPRFFLRSPLEIQLRTKKLGEVEPRLVNLVNFHFKSKRQKPRDPAELEWETYRMEMAEAIRRIAESRYAEGIRAGNPLVILLGDRNSHFDTASAEILSGKLTLKDFQEGGACRLSKRGVPLCKPDASRPKVFFSALLEDPQTRLQPGTFEYKKEYSWIDDILVPTISLRSLWKNFDTANSYNTGLVTAPEKASDHAMLWAKFNF